MKSHAIVLGVLVLFGVINSANANSEICGFVRLVKAGFASPSTIQLQAENGRVLNYYDANVRLSSAAISLAVTAFTQNIRVCVDDTGGSFAPGAPQGFRNMNSIEIRK